MRKSITFQSSYSQKKKINRYCWVEIIIISGVRSLCLTGGGRGGEQGRVRHCIVSYSRYHEGAWWGEGGVLMRHRHLNSRPQGNVGIITALVQSLGNRRTRLTVVYSAGWSKVSYFLLRRPRPTARSTIRLRVRFQIGNTSKSFVQV